MIYIEDSSDNRKILIKNIGKPTTIYDRTTYIEIDIQKERWRCCFDYEWLHGDKPNLTTIENVITILKLQKILKK
jgi:hypothetical protein